jgi:hypothetical protein
MHNVPVRETISRLLEGNLPLADRAFIAWAAAKGVRLYLRNGDIGPAHGCCEILNKLYNDKSPQIRRLVNQEQQLFDQQVGAA